MKMMTAERHEGQETPATEAREHRTGKEGSKRVTIGGARRVVKQRPAGRFQGR
jgi:hypothetical protein